IRFNDQTKIVELSEPIPTENFRFPKYEQLMVLGKTNVDLAGWLFFNAIFGTHFYFGHETLVSKCFLKVLCGAEGYYSSTPSTYGGVKKIKTVTLAELNTYVLNSQPHHSYGSITKLTNLSAAQVAQLIRS
ncbi:unnamed protein product, partial [Brassica rapa subsp. trilocularis]